MPPIVELSDHGFAVPAVASVLKFSVRGASSVVMFPLFVIADDERTIIEIMIAKRTRDKENKPTRRVG